MTITSTNGLYLIGLSFQLIFFLISRPVLTLSAHGQSMMVREQNGCSQMKHSNSTIDFVSAGCVATSGGHFLISSIVDDQSQRLDY